MIHRVTPWRKGLNANLLQRVLRKTGPDQKQRGGQAGLAEMTQRAVLTRQSVGSMWLRRPQDRKER